MSKQLPVHYFGHLDALLNEVEIDLYPYLKILGYDPETLKDPEASISSGDFNHLIQTLLREPGLTYLGLELGKRLQIAHHGAFGLAILNAPTLRSIITFVVEYLMTRIPFIELSLQESSDEFRVLAHDLEWERDVHRFLVEAVTMAFINLQIAMNDRGNHICITSLMFDFPEAEHEAVYRSVTHLDCQFDMAFSGFVISKQDAEMPLIGSDEISFQQARILCRQEKQAMISRASTAGKVRHYLHANAGKLPVLHEVAQALAMSERTLNRELAKEGTRFSSVADTWLARQAKEMLIARQLSVQQTAECLGYAEPSNFRRAFKRWFGCSPKHYKRPR